MKSYNLQQLLFSLRDDLKKISYKIWTKYAWTIDMEVEQKDIDSIEYLITTFLNQATKNKYADDLMDKWITYFLTEIEWKKIIPKKHIDKLFKTHEEYILRIHF